MMKRGGMIENDDDDQLLNVELLKKELEWG